VAHLWNIAAKDTGAFKIIDDIYAIRTAAVKVVVVDKNRNEVKLWFDFGNGRGTPFFPPNFLPSLLRQLTESE
jgi:hypothetical protein